MSTYENSRIGLENNDVDRRMSRMKEESKTPYRDRLKRPDKQLYVPRALRKTAVENKAVKSDVSKGVSRKLQKDETTVKDSQLFVNEKTVCGNGISERQKCQELDKRKTKDDKTQSPCLNNISSSRCSSIPLDKNSGDNRVIPDTAADYMKDIAVNVVNTVQKIPVNSVKVSSVNIVEGTGVNSVEDSIENHNIVEKGDISKEVEICSVISESCSFSDMQEDVKATEEGNISTSNDSENKLKKTPLNSSENGLQVSESPNALVHGDLKGNLQCADASPVQSSVAHANVSLENAEDSWETMFNDEGECLDPKFIKELSDITGRIDLTVAKSDYSDYQPVSTSTADEYNNIVELFGFPVEFSTQDLTSAFSMFQEASYNIKWVDDCHALAVFSSPVIASQALHLNHPFIKVRPLSEGIKESKEKARFCSRMFEAHKPRPVTSAALARRLVSGALGLKVNASKEQRDMERNILREAREKKKLKAKQRQDIWNGIVS